MNTGYNTTHLKCGRVGDANGEIGEDGKSLVRLYALEREIVCYFVDGEEEVMVCRAADNICA